MVSSVGKTTTMLAVVAEEPFGYIRYDVQFRRARELKDLGGTLESISAAALTERYAGF